MPTLKIKVHKASNIKNTDIGSLTDPMVRIFYESRVVSTRIIKDNLNPVWEEEFTLTLNDASSVVHFLLFDGDNWTADDLIAVTTLVPNSLAPGVKSKLELRFLPLDAAQYLFLSATPVDFIPGSSAQLDSLKQELKRVQDENERLKAEILSLKQTAEENNRLKAETDKLKRELEEIGRLLKAKEAEEERLKNELKKALDNLKEKDKGDEERTKLRKELSDANEALHREKLENGRLTDEVKKYQDLLKKAQDDAQNARDAAKRSEDELRKEKETNQRLREENDELKEVLGARPKEQDVQPGEKISVASHFDRFTVVSWIYPKEGSPEGGRIFDKHTASGTDGWLVDLFEGTRPRLLVFPNIKFHATQDKALPKGKWTHIAFTYDAGLAVLYVNGHPEFEGRNSGPITPNTHPIRIGFDTNGESVFEGQLRNPRIIYYPLTPEQVLNDSKQNPELLAPPRPPSVDPTDMTGLKPGEARPFKGPIDNFTAVTWVNPTKGECRFFDKITAGSNDGWLLDMHPGFKPRVIASPGICFNGPSELPQGQWSHVAMTYDGTTAVLYVNGQRVASAKNSQPLSQNSLPLRIGVDSGGGSVFAGQMKLTRFLFSCWSPLQVLLDFQLRKEEEEKPPVDATVVDKLKEELKKEKQDKDRLMEENAKLKEELEKLGKGEAGFPNATLSNVFYYGDVVQLKNQGLGRFLFSRNKNYTTPNTSGQQEVYTSDLVGNGEEDWIIKAKTDDQIKMRTPVKDGDVIRLEHRVTGKNLHSHGTKAAVNPSPNLADSFEVTGYGNNGIGDSNDYWTFKAEQGASKGYWVHGSGVRLMHTNTGKDYCLYSHTAWLHADEKLNQVCTVNFSDNNTVWNAHLVPLELAPPSKVFRYGDAVVVKNKSIGRFLSSHNMNYSNPGSSGQQQVFTSERVGNGAEYWIIKPQNDDASKHQKPVKHGDVIRLEHRLTRKNLHSHGNKGPVTPSMNAKDTHEVTGYGNNGNGDSNDFWTLRVDQGGNNGYWVPGSGVRLVHTNCGNDYYSLYSHLAWLNQNDGLSEVCAVTQHYDDGCIWNVELTSEGSVPENAFKYGDVVRLKNKALGNRFLFSRSNNYTTPNSSGQQEIFTSDRVGNGEEYWIIKPDNDDQAKLKKPVKNDDVIRLEHRLTRKNLHSHSFRAPVNPTINNREAYEVTGYGNNGNGDSNDFWTLRVDQGGNNGYWVPGSGVRLVHTNTGKDYCLYSHLAWLNHADGLSEVCTVSHHDDNSIWNADLLPTGFTPPSNALRYGDVLKFKNKNLGNRFLLSHSKNYTNPGSSGQQQVFTSEKVGSEDDLWIIKGPNSDEEVKERRHVKHGDCLRLEHKHTRKNLHSHGSRAPVNPTINNREAYEVTGYGNDGNGDSNDLWNLRIEQGAVGGYWVPGSGVRLMHVNTGKDYCLYSHLAWLNSSESLSEVCTVAHHDDGSIWIPILP